MINSSRFQVQPGTLTQDATIVSRGMEAGILIGVSAFFIDEGPEPITVWVELGVSRSASPTDRIALLSSGYLTHGSPVGWTGDLELGSDCFLYCTSHGITSKEFQVGYQIKTT